MAGLSRVSSGGAGLYRAPAAYPALLAYVVPGLVLRSGSSSSSSSGGGGGRQQQKQQQQQQLAGLSAAASLHAGALPGWPQLLLVGGLAGLYRHLALAALALAAWGTYVAEDMRVCGTVAQLCVCPAVGPRCGTPLWDQSNRPEKYSIPISLGSAAGVAAWALGGSDMAVVLAFVVVSFASWGGDGRTLRADGGWRRGWR
jgi:hypothetical protein